jgi:transcriptional regulator with XRE-family HTH domain
MLRPLSDVGKDVRRLREERGVTQASLAQLSGVSRPTISSLESGKRHNIGWLKMLAISEVLHDLVLTEDVICSK